GNRRRRRRGDGRGDEPLGGRSRPTGLGSLSLDQFKATRRWRLDASRHLFLCQPRKTAQIAKHWLHNWGDFVTKLHNSPLLAVNYPDRVIKSRKPGSKT